MAVGEGAQPPARSCPVNHHQAGATDPAQRPAQCPVDHGQRGGASECPARASSGGPNGGSANAEQPLQQQTQQQQPEEPQPEAEAKPMRCPLGFGSDNTAKLDPLNCVLCRSLYFETAQTVCGHRFCGPCIGPFRDCPLCGADCKPLSADAEMQGEAGPTKSCVRQRRLVRIA